MKHNKLVRNVLVVGFRNGQSLKDYLVRAARPRANEIGRCEPYGKKTCLVCKSIRTTATFTGEVCIESFKIQSVHLNCNSEKVLYLLKYKVYGEALFVGNTGTKGLITIKAKVGLLGKETEKYPRNFFTNIVVWTFI